MYLLILTALSLIGSSEVAMQKEIGTNSSWVVDQSVTDTADLEDLEDLRGLALVGVVAATAAERRGGIFVGGRSNEQTKCHVLFVGRLIAGYLQIFDHYQH